MGVGQHLSGILTGPGRHAGLSQQAHHLVLRVLLCPGGDNGVELVAVFPARRRGAESRIVFELLTPENFDKRWPHLRLHKNEHIVIGAARMAEIGGARDGLPQLIAIAWHGMAEALMIAQADAHKIDHGVLHRDFYVLSTSSIVPLVKRRK